MRAPLTQSLEGMDLPSWRTCLTGAGAALTRAAIAATTEILRNILTLDPGMQLSRNLGDKSLFIPRIKLGPSNNADPRKCHHGSGHTCMGKEAPARVGQRWVGLSSENCRSPLQKPGSACGKTRWLVEACAQGRWACRSYLQFHESLYYSQQTIAFSDRASPVTSVGVPVEEGLLVASFLNRLSWPVRSTL
jgi:hypothetical protein